MRTLGLALILTLCASCGSTKARLDETLESTRDLAQDVQKTSTALREDTLPDLREVLRATQEATEQLRELALQIQRLLVNLEPKIEIITQGFVDTLRELRLLAGDLRDLKDQVSLEVERTSDIRTKITDHGRMLDMALWVAAALGAVTIVLLIVMIHHKLTSKKRLDKELKRKLQNGGAKEFVDAMEPEIRRRLTGSG